MDDDDFDFASSQKRSAKTGRRAGAAAPTPALEEEELASVPSPTKKNSDGPPGRPNKAVSGWGEEAPPQRKPRTRQLGEGFETLEDDGDIFAHVGNKQERFAPRERKMPAFFDDEGRDDDNLFRERLKQSSPDKDSDSDNDIPVIPELEEQTEEDLTTKVAAAPNIAVNRVATYRELDNDLLKQAAFLTLDNEVDLKLLTKTLSPLEDIMEYDKPWDWDRLFTEISSELRTEWETEETEEEEKAVEPVQ